VTSLFMKCALCSWLIDKGNCAMKCSNSFCHCKILQWHAQAFLTAFDWCSVVSPAPKEHVDGIAN